MDLILLFSLSKRFRGMIFHLRLCAGCSHRSSNWLLKFFMRASVDFFWLSFVVSRAKLTGNWTLEKRFISWSNHAAGISSMLYLLSLQTLAPVLMMAMLMVKWKGRVEFWCTVVEIRRVSQSIIERTIHLWLTKDIIMLQENLMGIYNVGVVIIACNRNIWRLLIWGDHILINGTSIPLIFRL